MISDREAAAATAATYKNPTPDIVGVNNAVRVFITAASDGALIVAIEGTHDELGIVLDLLAIAVPDIERIDHPSLGMVDAGFLLAAQSVLASVAVKIDAKSYYLVGHSLGAAVALLLAGLFADAGKIPRGVFAFAPPRVGYAKFLTALSGFSVRAWRYHNDPVPLVPFTLPDFPYVQVPLIGLGPAPSHDLEWRDHHMENYVNALTSQEQAA